ncbi:hypothetical protein [Tengunoibacter tsumagoiensis]|uniref:Uncharacterized protein n=1 Tax=Tengunoibacter tsumagoiensis TaxID=2014871 RepID=A0A402A6F8_9CHLR|nr:hypothetical protein [Tengunoibacter tsumagoiensis]GCE14720.1 hypothetical protein KTT_45790 [Tengunoibacter tsumagoiensis]
MEYKSNLREIVNSASFDVYGIVNTSYDFLYSKCQCVRMPEKLLSVTLGYYSPTYSQQDRPPYAFPDLKDILSSSSMVGVQKVKSTHFSVTSLDIQQQPDPDYYSEFRSFQEATQVRRASSLFKEYGFTAEERIQAGSPSLWEETLHLQERSFSTKIYQWSAPDTLSSFQLRCNNILIMGQAHGPSQSELVQTLLELQVINQQQEILKQYEVEERYKGWF